MEYLKDGGFILHDFSKYSYLYFPLCNHYGLKSSITPNMNGDMKTDQFHFALAPSSNPDLLNNNNCRNVWFRINNKSIVNIAGTSLQQKINPDKETLECGFLYHKVTRENNDYKIVITSFVPEEVNLNVELHKIAFTNNTKSDMNLDAYVAVPIYGRSADNIRDHRQVTSLLNRVSISESMIQNKPTLSFDERGHNTNDTTYSVLVSDLKGNKPCAYYPTADEFMGEGGSLEMPKALYNDSQSQYKIGDTIGGYEALGGFKYETITIAPNETIELVYAISITKDESIDKVKKLCQIDEFNKNLEKTKAFWSELLSSLSFEYGNDGQGSWLKWVTLQPILRRIYGCSFLPHHDYGKGGRGWRDLWQDCLALIKMDPKDVKNMLINNFAGTRIDGSNATIIGSGLGEFKADRNNIVRMWMDHGAWPFVTTKLYIDNTNDYKILFENQPYFKDNHISFSKEIDADYQASQGTWQLDSKGHVYKGTILEHLLVANLAIYYNVGAHNNYRLMGADWNDGLDMADKNGESVAFTALYAQNLRDLSSLLKDLNTQGTKKIKVFKEFDALVSSTYDDQSVKEKRAILESFFASVKHSVSGDTIEIDTLVLSERLNKMYEEIKKQINENEWLESGDLGYYNGYYDNDSKQLENASKKDMILTGQVFTIMSGIASDDRVKKITESADKLLYKKNVGGYRLNTDFNEVKLNMGRLFGFAYGHKENGAVFSHMAIMYANALYRRDFAKEGYKVIRTIFEQMNDFELSKSFPGIPEYFDFYGRGMYPYLTGSASWLILTMVEEVFGVKVDKGSLVFKPRLVKEEFNDGVAKMKTLINGKLVTIVYKNPNGLDYGQYSVKSVSLNGVEKAVSIDMVKNNDELVVILGE